MSDFNIGPRGEDPYSQEKLRLSKIEEKKDKEESEKEKNQRRKKSVFLSALIIVYKKIKELFQEKSSGQFHWDKSKTSFR